MNNGNYPKAPFYRGMGIALLISAPLWALIFFGILWVTR